ncbi:MAG: hypothetical protein RLZZ628_3180 [Bacteroidota bacterium]|jgi:predicted Holliday junction resolvase-like endonuclease
MHHIIKYISHCFSVVLFFSIIGCSKDTNDSINDLSKAIEETDTYDIEKIQAIEVLKQTLNHDSVQDLRKQFKIYEKLFHAYEVFRYDSAFVYALKLQNIANLLEDKDLKASAKINFGYILVSSGMYKEAYDTLNTIQLQGVSNHIRAFYFGLSARYYNDVANYDNHAYFSNNYNNIANRYLDSSLILSSQGTFFNRFSKAFIQSQKGQLTDAYNDLHLILQDKQLPFHDYAITAFNLANLYEKNGQMERAIYYCTQASIADIKSSTKETAAIAKLAGLLYKKGDTKNASLCIKKANDDAIFYGARQRKIQIGAVLPLIEGSVINEMEAQKHNLYLYGIVVTFLLVLVIVLIITVYKQVGKLRTERNKVAEAHRQQQEINAQLTEANRLKDDFNNQLTETNEELWEANRLKDVLNHQLTEAIGKLVEANKIKEAYIGYYFNMDAEIFTKFEKFKTDIDKKLSEGKLADVRYILKSHNPQKEKEALVKNFDTIFINLFPYFVQDFNTLLKDQEQVKLKTGQLLNTELRIFALIRLGITDNEKIAQILGYSVNTIYMYKTKMRNKSWVANEDFDQKLVDITTLKN